MSERVQQAFTMDPGLSALTSIIAALANGTESQTIARLFAFKLKNIDIKAIEGHVVTQPPLHIATAAGVRMVQPMGSYTRKSIFFSQEIKDKVRLVAFVGNMKNSRLLNLIVDELNVTLGEYYSGDFKRFIADVIHLKTMQPQDEVQQLLKYIAYGDGQ